MYTSVNNSLGVIFLYLNIKIYTYPNKIWVMHTLLKMHNIIELCVQRILDLIISILINIFLRSYNIYP